MTVRLIVQTRTMEDHMPKSADDLRAFAARLAAGPAFLLLGRGEIDGGTPSVLYRWSGVYTTCVDDGVAEKFRTEWRTATSIGAMSSQPTRSETDLQVRHLFGGVHLPDGEKPATDALEEADARFRSAQELSRLASETTTPRGVVVIAGWAPGDSLEPRDLIPALRPLGPGQVHLFSSTIWAGDPFVASLAQAGQLVLHEDSLDEAMAQLVESGAIAIGGSTTAARGVQHVVALNDGFAEIDVHTWNQIRRSARPVDLELLTPPVFSSEAARYQEFRAFTGATEGSPRWRGIAAGMNILREFETTLATKVADALKDRDLGSPILLMGQTATGKSVAMAALASTLALSGEVAVLHQARRTVRPSLDDIDMYAAWAEERGAAATVLIWDGMVGPEEYGALSRQLRNRGRKVLIVGSTYLADLDGTRSVVAPVEMTDDESGQLIALLKPFGVSVTAPTAALDASFLAFLYHALPESHFTIRRGLAHELRAAEKGMEQLVRARGANATTSDRLSAMAAALKAAGFELDTFVPSTEANDKPLIEQTFRERSSVQRVTTLVLVAGRHGLPVPIDLALRILGREGSQSIRDALHSFDIIREVGDDSGEYFLSVRSTLEAELLAQHEIPLDVEIEVITEAIRNVRVSEGYVGAADEVQFLVSLLDRVGPNAKASKYKRFYGEVSEALRVRREETGRSHPRLVLQESNFERGSVHWRQETGEGTVADRVSDLEFNRSLLDEVLADPNLRGMMRLSLTVELASTLGAIMHELAADAQALSAGGLASQLDDILDAVLRARAIDPGNLYPVDVLAWSTRDALNTGALTSGERLNRWANSIATLDSIDRGPLSGAQLAQLDRRGAELNGLIGKDEAVWENLRNLEANADPAATFFLAKFEAEEGADGEKAALSRLQNAPTGTRTDWRCAQLLLDLTWRSIAGHRLLSGERVPLYLSPEHLVQLLRLTTELDEAELPDRYKLLFVRAVALFGSGDFAEAKRTFREVEELTRQLSRRIHTVVLLADESGGPKTFTGRVEWADARGGEVWVNELGAKVAFEPRLFSATQEFAKHQQLGALFIGFKLTRGPVAEPRGMYREQRKR